MSSPKPKFSIIILAYNEEKYLGACLDAIQNQSIPPDEVIVVNNNSTDRSAEIAGAYPFVTLINEKVQGMIPARNAGFNAASGDLLARIDADTQIPPDWTHKVHAILDAHAQTICGLSGPQYFYAIKNPVLRKIVSNLTSRYGYFGISRILLGHETLFGSNMVITRLAWEKVKNEACADSHKVHEDIDLAIHIGKYGRILFDPQLLVGVSSRPLREGPRKNIWRLVTWVRSITTHRKLFVGNARMEKS